MRLMPFGTCLVCVLVGWLVAGCAAVSDQHAEVARVLDPLKRGDLQRAAINAKVAAEVHKDDGDAVLRFLEAGTVLQAANRPQDSVVAFDLAVDAIAALDARPTVSARDAAGELAALATNPRVLPYRGTQSDRIMLHTYQALNYLNLGDLSAARVEINRAYDRQKEAVQHFEKAIEGAESSLRQKQINPQQVNLGKARKALKHRGRPPLAAYADFVNPLTTYLDALFFMGTAENGSDLERARKSIERMQGFSSDPQAFTDEAKWLATRSGSAKASPAVVVLSLEGMAPSLEQWRLDLPLPTRPVVHAGLAMPLLHYSSDRGGVRVGNGSVDTHLVADLDAVVAREFEESFDPLVLRSVSSAATKAVAQIQLKQALGKTAWVMGALGSIELTKADLRTWQTAPSRAVRAWLPRPANGKLEIQAAPGTAPRTLSLPDAPLVLVYVRRLSNTPPHISVIPLE